ncbi:hypothetical protein K470DRAFT_260964 [Piedraia hortae CBS 480.64]|uniref:Nudix hydrolase domain-containing protein n=1 Tax=Piedraia hortae CBS 480.64 TaxID=1314780 RepID=A0A6A7BQ88_9PEZI|nr:hypothetical protein K470DRAFT_260964 [Piedraia hortae CBS 480.64]
MPRPRPPSPEPIYLNIPCHKLVIGCGVAIFHLSTARVVLCYHTREDYYFLPKGRRNAGEGTKTAAEREGFEESGYRNRVLPLPIAHCQPYEDGAGVVEARTARPFVTEPILTQILPLANQRQYMLFWYVAETVPRELETGVDGGYVPPVPWEEGLTLRQRIVAEDAYEPVHHAGTGVNQEESYYVGQLVPVEEAVEKLRGSSMANVVRNGWRCIRLRAQMEYEMEMRARGEP